MHPIRKTFDTNESFPFSFAYKNTKSSLSELPDHFHDWYEIVYVYRGQGTFFIDHTFYDMKQGDLFLIPGNTIHRATPDKEMPVTSTAIYFSPSLAQAPNLDEAFSYLRNFEQAAELRTYKFETLLPQRRQIEFTLESIQIELKHSHLGQRQAIYLKLLELLLYLQRELGPERKTTNGDSSVSPIWMRDILLYIELHYCDDIRLTSLAQQASVSPAHFSRVFKQLIGMNITTYLMTKRIIRAKQLLSESDVNIGIIAEMCGFESLPHFHAMFKRMLGMTPAAARKAMR